jgi:hypothetical protein
MDDMETDTLFSFDEVPIQTGCRWFVKHGDVTRCDRGFKSKVEANDWIAKFGHRLDWRAGYVLRLRGDKQDISIVDKAGQVAKT